MKEGTARDGERKEDGGGAGRAREGYRKEEGTGFCAEREFSSYYSLEDAGSVARGRIERNGGGRRNEV